MTFEVVLRALSFYIRYKSMTNLDTTENAFTQDRRPKVEGRSGCLRGVEEEPNFEGRDLRG